MLGVEAGQSAVGDIFNWFAEKLVDSSEPDRALADLGERAAQLAPGEHGLLALDWFNGNRSILIDQRLTGLILGLTLQTEQHHILKALVEATAFAARHIIDAMESAGAKLHAIVAAGGLPSHAPWMIQTYSDILGREILIPRTDQGSALGAAIVASVAAGEFESIEAAQEKLVHFTDRRYVPDPDAAATYDTLFGEFVAVHDAFSAHGDDLRNVMKTLLSVRDRAQGAVS
jgi:L-ribulokinase